MPNPFASSGACPDRLVLQRWCDGDLSASEVQRVGDHVLSCVTCRAESDRLAQERTFVTVRLGEEDESWAAEAREVTGSVERRLAVTVAAPEHHAHGAAGWLSRVRGWLGALQGAGSRRRAAAGATVLAALVVGTAMVLDRWPMSASAERVLTDGQVRERAWRFTPGKIRMQTVRYDWREQGKPDRSAVRTRGSARSRATKATRAAKWTRWGRWLRRGGCGPTAVRAGPRRNLAPSWWSNGHSPSSTGWR